MCGAYGDMSLEHCASEKGSAAKIPQKRLQLYIDCFTGLVPPKSCSMTATDDMAVQAASSTYSALNILTGL